MKKIPTLFVRIFDEHHNKTITKDITPGMEWVLNGEGVATMKVDGSCCAIINGAFYKRYDAKKGKNPPECAIPCCDPDPITGHWPHWVKVLETERGDKWHIEAYKKSGELTDGTYEIIGPHFRDNPYGLEYDVLVKHGEVIPDVPRTYEELRDFLEITPIEGLVFWRDGVPQCKIKRSDFGFKWPVPEAIEYYRNCRVPNGNTVV